MSAVDIGLMVIIIILILALVKRPTRIVYVENPRNTANLDQPVNVDAEMQRLIRKIIQRHGVTDAYRVMYLIGVAASETDEPAPMVHWIEDGHIYFNFADEVARRKAMEWVQNTIIRDHNQLVSEGFEHNEQY